VKPKYSARQGGKGKERSGASTGSGMAKMGVSRESKEGIIAEENGGKGRRPEVGGLNYLFIFNSGKSKSEEEFNHSNKGRENPKLVDLSQRFSINRKKKLTGKKGGPFGKTAGKKREEGGGKNKGNKGPLLGLTKKPKEVGAEKTVLTPLV